MKFGNIGCKLGSNDFIKPRSINENVRTFGMIKCFKSIKKIIKKINPKIKRRIAVILIP